MIFVSLNLVEVGGGRSSLLASILNTKSHNERVLFRFTAWLSEAARQLIETEDF